MKKINLQISAVIYDDFVQLSTQDQVLMNKAIYARNNAYAPYSKFNVGAAVLLNNKKIITGNNQENAAYPSGMCAERIAVWKAASRYPKKHLIKIAVTGASYVSKVTQPVGPCGACRQSLLEYEINQKQAIEIIFMGETGNIVKVNSLLSLLPFSFDSSFIN